MGLYDEVEIEDMEWSDELEAFTYSCPCGDLFQITLVCSDLCICMSGSCPAPEGMSGGRYLFGSVAFSVTDSFA
jgi:hypothetical protein